MLYAVFEVFRKVSRILGIAPVADPESIDFSFRIPYQHIALGLVAFAYIFCLQTQLVLAADMWTKAETIMKDVYGKILGISTIAAIVTASVALLMMNFSKSGKAVDESRARLKRIAISWVILNGLGFILAYVTPFFTDGKWNG